MKTTTTDRDRPMIRRTCVRRMLGVLGFLGASLLASAVPGHAQLAWDTPRLSGPDRPEGMGVYWLKAGTLPGDGDALLVTWSPPGLGDRITLRGGAGTGVAGVSSGFAGLDWRAPIARHALGHPLDLSWAIGGGVGVGDHVMLSAPIGVSAGRSWFSGPLWLAPYASLGLAVDVRVGDYGVADRWSVSPAADVGLDFSMGTARRFVARAAVSLGDRQSFVLGGTVRTLR